MRIALDYDDTYTADPEAWDNVIATLLNHNHDVRIVTARHFELDKIEDFIIPVIYCNGVAKQWWCHHYEDFDPDVWVDDSPQSILQNSTMSKEALSVWRAERD